ncbi:MAG: F0F1 ATP synthase subunit A [Pirellula sp.]
MSDLLLHIKDSYYFELPKVFWKSNVTEVRKFPSWLIRIDDSYQNWEADYLLSQLPVVGATVHDLTGLKDSWLQWQHEKGNYARPLDEFVDQKVVDLKARAIKWAKRNAKEAQEPVQAYLASTDNAEPYRWAYTMLSKPEAAQKWANLKASVNTPDYLGKYVYQSGEANWSADKIAKYNKALDGKVLIPQPLGTLRNAYEPASGFCISRFMIIEVCVAIFLILLLSWLGRRVVNGDAPKGKLWNAVEGLMEYVRKQAFVPAMGEEDSKRFLPFLWTLFVFIFAMNLAGMIPFVGSPTASLAVTGSLALVVFIIGVVCGVRAMGPIGYLKNVCPALGLPPVMAIVIVPLLWTIEFVSLFMKHGILALRLLANMVAGHAVLLGLMGLAIGVHAYAMSTPTWSLLAGVTAIGMVSMSLLELFIAFLQAAMFTFLAALFIGSSLHHH